MSLRNFIILILVVLGVFFLISVSGCKEKSVMDTPPEVIEEQEPEEDVVIGPITVPTPPAADPCELTDYVAKVRATGGGIKEIKLPATGKMVMESHLRTKSDINKWPSNSTEGIEQHLANSCKVIRLADSSIKADCSNLYDSKYEKVWTPAEGGKIGQGSVGDLLPSVEQEMYSGNMNWSSKPKPGTKFLAQHKSKSVVFVMGFETGPGDTNRWLGGLQPEVHHLLGTGNTSDIKIGLLKNQDIALGKIQCGS